MDTKKQAKSFIRQAGEGERRWFHGGGVHTWLATAEETDGASLIYRDAMESGKVTPMHIHPDTDEALYILSGRSSSTSTALSSASAQGFGHGTARATTRIQSAGRGHEPAVFSDARQRPGFLHGRQRTPG
ncbi:hypothetical protein NHF46_20075 [Arthrobacter alpinus]|nr:hypothetical protein [Arthrobacter alpinus]